MSDGPWRAWVGFDGRGVWVLGTRNQSFDMILELHPGPSFGWDMEKYAKWLADRLNTFPPYDQVETLRLEVEKWKERATPPDPKTPAEVQKRIGELHAEIQYLSRIILGDPTKSVSTIIPSP